MDTKLKIYQIEYAIAVSKKFSMRTHLIIPNVSWGFLNHEADLISVSKAGYITEIEIKRSFQDFKADFQKRIRIEMKDDIISYFYFAIPESIVKKVVKWLIINHPEYHNGILAYTDYGKIYEVSPQRFNGQSLVNKKKTPITIQQKLRLAELGCMRVWSLKRKLSKITKDEKG